MNNIPLVSVIIPVYNVEPYLRQCLDSVICQTYTNLEILIIDDGSTDECGKLCDEYKQDGRVKVFHTENFGLSAARNLGLDNANGEYLSFIDSDDWVDSNLLEKAVGAIEDADILCSSKNEGTYNGYEALCGLINGKISNRAWDKLYRKVCFSSLRFPEGRIFEDIATMFKLLDNANIVVCKNIHGYHYRKREGSITQTHNKQYYFDFWEAIKERYEYCAEINDKETRINLLKSCAISIASAWAWRIIYSPDNSYEWESMSRFARNKLTFDVYKHFPIRIVGGVFLAKFNCPLSFWLAHRINVLTKRK